MLYVSDDEAEQEQAAVESLSIESDSGLDSDRKQPSGSPPHRLPWDFDCASSGVSIGSSRGKDSFFVVYQITRYHLDFFAVDGMLATSVRSFTCPRQDALLMFEKHTIATL